MELQLTQTLKNAVVLMNDFKDDKFPLLLQRIIKNLDKKDQETFSEAEKEQLANLFDTGKSELGSVIEASSFIFEQCAYYTVPPKALKEHLEKIELTEEKIVAFQRVWNAEALDLVTKLKQKSLIPHKLDSVGWRLHLQMSQTNMARINEPSAIFELRLNSNKENQEKLQLEFSKEELQQFYLRLEELQGQLDKLS